MNPNRQMNRCVTPGGPGFTGRPGPRPMGGVVGAANNFGNPCPCDCNPCNDGLLIGGILLGQGCAGCNPETALEGMPIAMAYVPWQSYGNIFNLQRALQCGTIFQELSLEFEGRRC